MPAMGAGNPQIGRDVEANDAFFGQQQGVRGAGYVANHASQMAAAWAEDGRYVLTCGQIGDDGLRFVVFHAHCSGGVIDAGHGEIGKAFLPDGVHGHLPTR
jgi:hypothetical protein